MRSPKRIRGCPPRPELWPGLILQDLKKRRPRLRVRGKSLVHAGGGGVGGPRATEPLHRSGARLFWDAAAPSRTRRKVEAWEKEKTNKRCAGPDGMPEPRSLRWTGD